MVNLHFTGHVIVSSTELILEFEMLKRTVIPKSLIVQLIFPNEYNASDSCISFAVFVSGF